MSRRRKEHAAAVAEKILRIRFKQIYFPTKTRGILTRIPQSAATILFLLQRSSSSRRRGIHRQGEADDLPGFSAEWVGGKLHVLADGVCLLCITTIEGTLAPFRKATSLRFILVPVSVSVPAIHPHLQRYFELYFGGPILSAHYYYWRAVALPPASSTITIRATATATASMATAFNPH